MDNNNFSPAFRDGYVNRMGRGAVGSRNQFNPDADTAEGLFNIAKQHNLGDEAMRVTQRVGGNDLKYFSGGVISDLMDVLSTGSYAIAGMAKGVGAIEGVKSRASWTDEELLGKYGTAGKVAGFALDVVADPFFFIAPAKVLKAIPGVTRGVKAAESKLLGDWITYDIAGGATAQVRERTFLSPILDKVVYGYGADEKFLNGFRKVKANEENAINDAGDIVAKLTVGDNPALKRIMEQDALDGTMKRRKLEDLEIDPNISVKELESARQLYKVIDDGSEELVRLGVFSKEAADEYFGTYLKQYYDEHLKTKVRTSNRLTAKVKQRNNELTKEIRDELGIQKDAGLVFSRTIMEQQMLIRNARLGKLVNDTVAATEDDLVKAGIDPVKDGWVKIPESANMKNKPTGAAAGNEEIATIARNSTSLNDFKAKLSEEQIELLGDDKAIQKFYNNAFRDIQGRSPVAGKYIPKPIYELLDMQMNPSVDSTLTKAMIRFKHANVLWNPSSYGRNMVSATIQNWWKLGLGPWNAKVYTDAIKDFNANGKYTQEMKQVGWSTQSGILSELATITTGDEIKGILGKVLGLRPKFITKAVENVDKKALKWYSNIDNIAKVAAYKYAREVKGMDPEEAMKAAYQATYNYQEVTPFIHQLRKSFFGAPFITFSLKSVPLVTDTVLKTPWKISVFGKAQNDLFKAAGIDGEKEAEVMPDYMRDDQFMLRLPWKDQHGRSMYFDMTYILPYGDILSGAYLTDPVAWSPAIQTIRELYTNQTFDGKKIFRESDSRDQVVQEVIRHTLLKWTPPPLRQLFPQGYSSEGEYLYGNLPNQVLAPADESNNRKTMLQSLAQMLGANMTPYSYESREASLEFRRKDALQQLLVDNGIMKEYTRAYIPKETQPSLPSNPFQ